VSEALLGLGRIAQTKGQTDEAVAFYEKAIQSSRVNSAAYDALGAVYFPRHDYAKAAEYFSQALSSNPYDFGARFYLGTCWKKLGRYREAAQQFRAAREADPTYWQAFEAEASALEAAGDIEGAALVRKLAYKK
jgi:tetratricopeptide (TPR) repeat protein